MANRTINTKIKLRNDTSANWVSRNPILLIGEVGLETDTRKIKIGDGNSAWNALNYTDAQKADTATKLAIARTISITGDATGSASFDGSANAPISIVLANSGVAAGTYTKLTVNSKGLVTGSETLLASDIPNLTLSKITDAGTAASKNVGTAVGNVVQVNSDGKISESVIPAVAISEVFVVDSESEMLALAAQRGDVAVRTDLNKSFILQKEPASTLANWVGLLAPDCKVLSVNGKTGAVVLTTGNITEQTNLYYTDARATANFNTNFATKSVTGLSDGANVLMSTDTYIFDGGNA